MSAPRRRRRPCGGQASIELIAAIPLLVGAGLVAWQLLAVRWAGIQAQERLRADGLRAQGRGELVHVRAHAPVPAVLPGLGGLRVEVRGAVRTP
jgi:hypothetical protein